MAEAMNGPFQPFRWRTGSVVQLFSTKGREDWVSLPTLRNIQIFGEAIGPDGLFRSASQSIPIPFPRI